MNDILKTPTVKPSCGFRIGFVDWAKAVSIALICIGHFLSGGNFLKVVLCSFHLPVFAVISGFLFYEPPLSISTILTKLFKRLMIPYMLFTLLSLPYYLLLYLIRNQTITSAELLTMIFYLKGYVTWNAPLWYLPAIFFSILIFTCFYTFSCKKSCYHSVVMLGTLSFALVCILDYFQIKECVLGYNKILLFSGYICIGFLLKKASQTFDTGTYDSKVAVLSAVIFLVACVISGYINLGDNISFLDSDYNNIFVFLPLSIAASVSFLFSFSGPSTNKMVDLLSKNSVFIMSSHYFILIVWKNLFPSNFLMDIQGGCLTVFFYMALLYELSRVPAVSRLSVRHRKWLNYLGISL